MYVKRTWRCGKCIEVEKYQTFRYKGKMTVRAPQSNPTPAAMAKVNERNSYKNLRRLLNTNFGKGDLHCVLTYAPEKRAASPQEAKKDIQKFCRNVKQKCKRRGSNFKYVAVAEYGKRSMHFHVVIHSRLKLQELGDMWPHGRIHATELDGSGDYDRLASYLIKQTNKTYNDPERRVFARRYVTSRNLEQPECKIEKVKADSWRETPSAPKGFYVLQDTIVQDVSEITGYPYQYYRCLALGGGKPLKTKRLRR